MAARPGQYQAELDIEKRLIGYVRMVQWNALAPATKLTPTEKPTTPVPAAEGFSRDSIQRSVHIFLDATNMARTAPHRWTQRNSRRTTKQLDHNRGSFAIKALHGNIPTMVRQRGWYNEACSESEMQLCPRGCGKKEDQ
ncbi:hypothetical protein GGI25_005890 [Coemansia spiralis]|uniref:Uncharacterized protein n=2 Tax=Coemansia TaxID=4863 RepID=A0A9W8G3Q4_9FUNG|nr:hypothetical protein EDC05_002544 [Coemansia umbellata]KAJ2622584.1 hypothetical protein GGI26_003183 [Coemansia sp. RSA 1358]KAJ2670308.1 hypothetical protein GGI25_005890 [Coemansia spiralis]